MSDYEPDVDEEKEWSDLEHTEQDVYLPDDEELILEEESDEDIPVDHGKGYRRSIKVKFEE